MKRLLVSKITLPTPIISLRGCLSHYIDSKEYGFIEDEQVSEHSIFVLDYLEFTDVDNMHLQNLIKLSRGSGHLLIRHDFGVNIPTLLSSIENAVQNISINPCNITLQITYEHEKEELLSSLENKNINGIKIFTHEPYMDVVYKDYLNGVVNFENNIVTKKFSIFSRRFSDDRFVLYLELAKRNLLEHFTYTFSNGHAEIKPYEDTIILPDKLIEIASNLGYTDDHIISWIKGIPYSDFTDFYDPFAKRIYKLMSESAVNIVIETCTMYNFALNLNITEKTYKPIILKKPFYIYGTNAIELLQSQGFKTFNPLLDEKYSSFVCVYSKEIEYFKSKTNAICDDVERLNNLPKKEFDELIERTKEITEYNYNHFLKLAKSRSQNIIDLMDYLQLIPKV